MKSFFLSLILVLLLFANANADKGVLLFIDIQKSYYDSYELEKQKRFRESMTALDPVSKAYPNGYTVNYRLGWLAYNNGSFADALKYYNRALAIYPSSLEIMSKRIYLFVAQKKWSLVEDEARRIIRISYYDATANYWLAYALRQQKKYTDAVKIVMGYITVFPTSTTMLVELGLLQDIQGEKSSAIATFQSVIILDSYNQTAQNYLKEIEGE